MSSFEDAAERLRMAERVSIPAVVVPEGVDPTPYLLKAGILNPVAIPFATGETGRAVEAMGHGWTPAVRAQLETIDHGLSSGDAPGPFDATGPDEAEQAEAEPAMQTANLPEAFGRQPLAPVWRPARA